MSIDHDMPMVWQRSTFSREIRWPIFLMYLRALRSDWSSGMILFRDLSAGSSKLLERIQVVYQLGNHVGADGKEFILTSLTSNSHLALTLRISQEHVNQLDPVVTRGKNHSQFATIRMIFDGTTRGGNPKKWPKSWRVLSFEQLPRHPWLHSLKLKLLHLARCGSCSNLALWSACNIWRSMMLTKL